MLASLLLRRSFVANYGGKAERSLSAQVKLLSETQIRDAHHTFP
jgi:hypothetical protein